MKMARIQYSLIGHTDSVTGLALDPTGSFVLSNSMDNSGRPDSTAFWVVAKFLSFVNCSSDLGYPAVRPHPALHESVCWSPTQF